MNILPVGDRLAISPGADYLGLAVYRPFGRELGQSEPEKEPTEKQTDSPGPESPTVRDRPRAIALASLVTPGAGWQKIRATVRRAEFLARGILMSH